MPERGTTAQVTSLKYSSFQSQVLKYSSFERLMSKRRTIDVRPQVNLSLAKTFRLCTGGIAHRLLRSFLTLAVVVLAVAFFMFLLSESMFVRATAEGVSREIREARMATRLLNYLFEAPSSLLMSRRLAQAAQSEAQTLDEYASITGWERGHVSALADVSAREQAYLAFFENIPVGNRLVLVRKLKGREVFRHLGDGQEQSAFAERIAPMLDISLPGEMAGFTAFLAEFPDSMRELDAFTTAWRETIQALRQESEMIAGGADVLDWLRQADEVALRSWVEGVQARGFDMNMDVMTGVQAQLRQLHLTTRVSQELNTADMTSGWKKAFKQRKRLTIAQKLPMLDDDRAVKLLADTFTRDELDAVAAHAREQARLSVLEKRLSGKAETGAAGGALTPRQGFLLLISFVVCMVGIANAMLMSITERFREIATMKCLGATDQYILVQFMMEAGLQGIAGGLLGMMIGFTIAVAKNSASFGATLFAYWPGDDLLSSAGVSMAAGVLLAVLASIYPSWSASRMVPMEAMRVE